MKWTEIKERRAWRDMSVQDVVVVAGAVLLVACAALLPLIK
jgi:hypothetical protein